MFAGFLQYQVLLQGPTGSYVTIVRFLIARVIALFLSIGSSGVSAEMPTAVCQVSGIARWISRMIPNFRNISVTLSILTAISGLCICDQEGTGSCFSLVPGYRNYYAGKGSGIDALNSNRMIIAVPCFPGISCSIMFYTPTRQTTLAIAKLPYCLLDFFTGFWLPPVYYYLSQQNLYNILLIQGS